MQDFLSGLHRAVLLGNPGGGKSTFTHKLCYDLAKHYAERRFGGRLVTPFHVTLRDYGAEKKTRNCSLLQYIESTSNSDYQVQAPHGAIEYLMLSGRSIIVFDGLDELLDSTYRQEISSDIEAFCNLYPAVPVLVTSRQVGYEQAPLDEKRFDIFTLGTFDAEQISEYVSKWFRIETDLLPEQQKLKTEAFLKESRIVPDLTSNPLMLALMCNIYRGENYIPRNRPDVYGKCAEMLFERWDKSRGINAPLPFEAQIRPSLMYLAHWIYSNADLQAGVTEQKLVAKTTDYLSGRRFENHDDAEVAARGFIEFCKGRAWVFTDTGTMKGGDSLYQFTHRTFLEYFTAGHLVRTNPTPSSLLKILLPRIRKSEWDVVAQLAFQLQTRSVEGAGDKLISALIGHKFQGDHRARFNALSFAVRCLEFIVPSPKVTRLVASIAILNLRRQHLFRIRDSRDFRITLALLHAASENRKPVASTFTKLLLQDIASKNQQTSLWSAHFALNLPNLVSTRDARVSQARNLEEQSFLNDLSRNIFDQASSTINKLSVKNLAICNAAVRLEKIPVSFLVEHHGTNSIFEISHEPLTTYRFVIPSLAALMTYWYVDAVQIEANGAIFSASDLLTEIGRTLLTCKPPWVNSRKTTVNLFEPIRFVRYHGYGQPANSKRVQRSHRKLDNDGFFGIFAVFAPSFEFAAEIPKHIYDEILEEIPDRSLATLLNARVQRTDAYNSNQDLKQLNFNAQQQDFIDSWIKKEISLIVDQKLSRRRNLQKQPRRG